jgi:hypothetical protein
MVPFILHPFYIYVFWEWMFEVDSMVSMTPKIQTFFLGQPHFLCLGLKNIRQHTVRVHIQFIHSRIWFNYCMSSKKWEPVSSVVSKMAPGLVSVVSITKICLFFFLKLSDFLTQQQVHSSCRHLQESPLFRDKIRTRLAGGGKVSHKWAE